MIWPRNSWRSWPACVNVYVNLPWKYISFSVCFHFGCFTFWPFEITFSTVVWLTGRRWELNGVDVIPRQAWFPWNDELTNRWLAEGAQNRANRNAGLDVWDRGTPIGERHPLLHGCSICCPGSYPNPLLGLTTPVFRDYNLYWRTTMLGGLSSIQL